MISLWICDPEDFKALNMFFICSVSRGKKELDEVRKTYLWLRRVHWGWKELFDVGKKILRLESWLRLGRFDWG